MGPKCRSISVVKIWSWKCFQYFQSNKQLPLVPTLHKELPVKPFLCKFSSLLLNPILRQNKAHTAVRNAKCTEHMLLCYSYAHCLLSISPCANGGRDSTRGYVTKCIVIETMYHILTLITQRKREISCPHSKRPIS